MTPEPVAKGFAVEIATGRRVSAFFLKHDVNIGETAADDCFIGGVKEDTPNAWNFNTSAGGCTTRCSLWRCFRPPPKPTTGA